VRTENNEEQIYDVLSSLTTQKYIEILLPEKDYGSVSKTEITRKFCPPFQGDSTTRMSLS
jgi:hypothetical protein